MENRVRLFVLSCEDQFLCQTGKPATPYFMRNVNIKDVLFLEIKRKHY